MSRKPQLVTQVTKVPPTIKEAAWAAMPAAYQRASARNTLPANSRQVMYAARPSIQDATSQTLDSKYFTQILLPDYMAAHPGETADWDVVWDDRGHFREPHTNHEIGLGTLAVRTYIEDLRDPELAPARISSPWIYTKGPAGRYGSVLFIEKEGFTPILQAANIPERFDIAVMSTKGMSVTASRMLVEELCGRRDLPLSVLHDFDLSGFSIKQTLTTSNRRHTFAHEIEPIDLGLRLADVARLGLPSERVVLKKLKSPNAAAIEQHARALANRLRINGATEAEIEFLLSPPPGDAGSSATELIGQRVELNAMSSDVFVRFVEDGLRAHGFTKVTPRVETLGETYTAFLRGAMAKEALEAELERLNAEPVAVPPNLEARVRERLEANPTLTWDDAVGEIVAEDTP